MPQFMKGVPQKKTPAAGLPGAVLMGERNLLA